MFEFWLILLAPALFILLCGLAGYIILRSVVTAGNNAPFLKGKTIVPTYEPPADLSAAELGLLADQKSGRLEYLAAIYQLKTRKIIAIEGRTDGAVGLKLLKYPPGLSPHDDLVVRYLFHAGPTTTLAEVQSRGDAGVMVAYSSFMIEQSLQRKGYIFKEPGYEDLSYQAYLQRTMDKIMSGGPEALGVAAGAPFMAFDYLFHGVRNYLTQKAKDSYPEIAGFQQYIETAELDKIKFHAQGNLEEYIERLTPYAIALGQMERWQLLQVPLASKSVEITIGEPETQPTPVAFDMIAQVAQIESYKIKPSRRTTL